MGYITTPTLYVEHLLERTMRRETVVGDFRHYWTEKRANETYHRFSESLKGAFVSWHKVYQPFQQARLRRDHELLAQLRQRQRILTTEYTSTARCDFLEKAENVDMS